MKKVYLIYDARYRYDEDAATLFEACYTLEEAIENHKDYGNDTVIVECDLVEDKLHNPKIKDYISELNNMENNLRLAFQAGARRGHCLRSKTANVGATCYEPDENKWIEDNYK